MHRRNAIIKSQAAAATGNCQAKRDTRAPIRSATIKHTALTTRADDNIVSTRFNIVVGERINAARATTTARTISLTGTAAAAARDDKEITKYALRDCHRRILLKGMDDIFLVID